MTTGKQALLKEIVTSMLQYNYSYPNKDEIEFTSKSETVEGSPEYIVSYKLPGLKTELRKFLKENIRLS